MSILFNSDELVSPKTAAETVTFTLGKSDVPARLTASGLAGAETVTLKTMEGPNGSVEVTPTDDAGDAITLVVAHPVIPIYAPGPYKVTKPVTAGAVGIYLAKG